VGQVSRTGLDLSGWRWSHRLVTPLLPAPISISTRSAPLTELGEKLGSLRLGDEAALAAMRQSLAHHGQLQPLVVFEGDGLLQVIDGFKRLHAARALGWDSLMVTITGAHPVEAKVQLVELQQGQALTELEEGLVIRSLHREDGLSQGAIAERMGRHKSWICRRLLLVEGLDPVLHAHLRLGLVKARAAVAIAALPRGNQVEAAEVVARRGLTVRQTTRMVAELQAAPNPAQWQARLCGWREGRRDPIARRHVPRVVRSEAEGIAADVATLCRICARLEARLLARPLIAHGAGSHITLSRALDGLLPVLDALLVSIRISTAETAGNLATPAAGELT